MTIEQVNAGLKADPKFQQLLKTYNDAIQQNSVIGHTPTDNSGNAQALRGYAESFAKSHGFDPGGGGLRQGDSTNLDTTTGQYSTVHDVSGWHSGLVPALAPLIAGTAGIAGAAALGGAGAEEAAGETAATTGGGGAAAGGGATAGGGTAAGTGATAGGAATGGATGAGGAAGGGSTLGSVINGASKLAPILGRAAAGSQADNLANDRNTIANEGNVLKAKQFAVDAPGERLSSALRAAIAGNFTPTTTQWEGPGSGARGKIPTHSGGAAGVLANLPPEAKQLAQEVLRSQLQNQLTNTDGDTPAIGQESTGDKVLGGLATGTSVLGGLKESGLLDSILKKKISSPFINVDNNDRSWEDG